MSEGKGRISLISLSQMSVFVAFFIAGIDSLSLNFTKILSFEELFLLGTRHFKTSIAVYTFLLVFALCFLLSVAASVVKKLIPRLAGMASWTFYVLFYAVVSSVVLFGLRLRFFDSRVDFRKYLIVFTLSAVMSFIALGAAILLSKRFLRLERRVNRHAAVLVVLICFIFFFFLPGLQNLYWKWRFQPPAHNPEKPNVLLIIMDTTRADALSCYNPEKRTTPNIDRIAGEGMLFSKAVSTAQWTAPSHSSIFTGLYPSQHRTAWDYAFLDEGFFTLAECLAEAGYQTVGFSENAFVSKRRGYGQGFETYYGMSRYPRMAVTSRLIDRARIVLTDYEYSGEYARDTARYFKRWVLKNQGRKERKPFFAFINFMPAHLPHYHRDEFSYVQPEKKELLRIEPVNRVPERFYLPQFKLNEKELETLRLLYEGDVSYLDSVLGDIYGFLKESKLLDNTLLIITSDHGENFGDHGYFEHFFSLHNTLLHVPLVIRYPKRFGPGSVNNDLVSTVFLYQTVLNLIGDKGIRPPYPIESRSLLATGDSGFFYAEHESAMRMIKGVTEGEAPEDFDFAPFDKLMKSIYTSDYKLIWSSNGQSELYDIEKDWQEKENLFSSNTESASLLQAKLNEWLENLWRPAFAKRQKMDEKTEEALKALGYIK